MSTRVTKLTIFKDRDNPAILGIKQRRDGTLSDVPFDAVARMVLTLEPNGASPVEVDTQNDPGSITYSTDGQVVFAIGKLSQITGLTEGDYYARLVAIDQAGGQTELVNEDMPGGVVIFAIRDTTSV